MRRPLMALAMTGILAIVACGEGGTGGTSTQPGQTTTQGQQANGISTASTDLGTILVDSNGFTLYVFTLDTDGESTCYNSCAALWPAVPGGASIGSGLDASIFGTTTRTDGTSQMTVNGQPLYRYTSDLRAGDVTGQGVEGVWFVVDSNGDMAQGSGTGAQTGTTRPRTTQPSDDDDYDYGY